MSSEDGQNRQQAAFERACQLLPPRYTPTRILGSGGMSVVIAAQHQSLETEVAIKLLHEGFMADDNAKARFLREAQIAAGIKHPNIVPVRDVNEVDGYIVMDLIEGQSLKQRIRNDGPLTSDEVISLARKLLSALRAAHNAGVIHRDIKPANILIDKSGHIWLTDFGVAYLSDSELTRTGAMTGTPAYMSPEQLRGYPIDLRSDFYALGASLFEALTGRRLHSVEGDPVNPNMELNDEIDQSLRATILRALQENPDARFDNADAFERALTTPVDPQNDWSITRDDRLAFARPGISEANASASQVPFTKSQGHEVSHTAIILSAALILISVATIISWFVWSSKFQEQATQQSKFASVMEQPKPIIALLPFDDTSTFQDLEFTPGGLPYLLGHELNRVPSLKVLGYYHLRSHIKGDPKADHAWVSTAKRLGADVIIKGKLSPTSNSERVRIELFAQDPEKNTLQSWTREVKVREVPKVARTIAKDIASEILGKRVSLEVSPEVFEFQQALLAGIAAMESHHMDVALIELGKAARINPASSRAYYRLAVSAWWAGKSQRQIQRYAERAVALGLDGAEEIFLSGLELLTAAEHADAIRHYQRALTKHPGHRDLLYGYFEALFHGGRAAEAFKVYKQIARLHPTFRLGIMHALSYSIINGEDGDVEWALEQARAKQDPNQQIWALRSRIARGEIEQSIEKLQALSEHYRDAPTNDPAAAAVRQTLLSTYALTGRTDLALALTSDQPSVSRYALMLARGKEVGRDILLKKRDQMEPHSQVQGPWLSLALIEWIQGRPPPMDAVFKTAKARHVALLYGRLPNIPENPQMQATAHALRAEKKKMWKEAAHYWEQSASLAGDANPWLFSNFRAARAFRHLDQSEDLLRNCQAVISPKLFHWTWAPMVGPCLLWMAQARAKLGQTAMAQVLAQRLLDLRVDASAKDELRQEASTLLDQLINH